MYKLTLKGAPKEVGINFNCGGNQLTSLEYAPKKVDGSFLCYNNARQFTKDYVLKVSNVKRHIQVEPIEQIEWE